MNLQEYREELPLILAVTSFVILLALTLGLYKNKNASVKIWQVSDLKRSGLRKNAEYRSKIKVLNKNGEEIINKSLVKTKLNDFKEFYIQWMESVSNENRLILETIYSEVSKYPLKDLLLAIIYNETWPKFNPWSYSRAGAICLMQVNPTVWVKELKKRGIIRKKSELWRIDRCIKAGNYILNFYLKQYNGDVRKALIAYVGGDKKYADNVLKTLGWISALKMIALKKQRGETRLSSKIVAELQKQKTSKVTTGYGH